MPLYTFRCRRCGEITQVAHGFFESHPKTCHQPIVRMEHIPVKQSMGDYEVTVIAPRSVLHDCGGELVRVFDIPQVHYRGSGFYTTDSKLTPVDPLDYNNMED